MFDEVPPPSETNEVSDAPDKKQLRDAYNKLGQGNFEITDSPSLRESEHPGQDFHEKQREEAFDAVNKKNEEQLIQDISDKNAGKGLTWINPKESGSLQKIDREIENRNAEELIHEDYGKYIDGDPADLTKEGFVKYDKAEEIPDKHVGLDKHTGASLEERNRNLRDLNRENIPEIDKGDYGVTDRTNEQTISLKQQGPLVSEHGGENPQTRIHEGLHAHSAWELNEALDEGVTEHFTAQTLEKHNISQDHESVYPERKEIADKMADKYGEDVLAKAYFNGDVKGLEDTVDHELGEGAFKEINRCLDHNEFEYADYILEHGLEDYNKHFR